MRVVWLCFAVCLGSVSVLSQLQCSRPDCYGKFWHVTDFHYDHTYTSSQLSCNARVDRPAALGDYWCDSPWALVTAAIDAMATYPEEVDFVLWTGDTVAHISNDNLTTTINMDVLQNLTNAMTRAFPHTPVFAAFGNHDYYPASQFPAVPSLIYNTTADMWRDWIGEEEQMANFRKGGYYTRLIPSSGHKLRMVVLNTNLYYTSDKATLGIHDPTGQLHWLGTVLARARNQHEKVILAAHIPPGVHTPRGVHWYQEEFVGPITKVLRDYADVIKAMHFGHDHYDGFKVFYDHKGMPAIPLFVAPSVTPWRFKLPSGEVGPPHNPAIRLVTYDRQTGDHVNVEQYRLDLPLFGQGQEANFTLLYSFTEHYRLHDVSAASLHKLVTRMASSSEGDALLNDYFRFAAAGADGNDRCDQVCKRKILCGFGHYTRADYSHCLNHGGDTVVPVG
ncbi:acid sphingomyelinase-like phosphodiesterase 3b [Babylonia areolata]|uniref:acid sphingomyelinase-like phosphodiesterase 3b n=1 Tax=Babylonia areolata TaxID=304850 RepID=UPI003FD1034C